MHRLAADSLAACAAVRFGASNPFSPSKHPFTNHSRYPASRAVNVPPRTIKSTLSVSWPILCNASTRDADKVDLIVLGGTFTALEAGYREWFVKGCFDGLNGFEAPNLTAAQAANESAASRCIGLTIETKPDCFLGVEVAESLDLGATRVELGIQTTHDDVLERVHRGHTDAQSREAMRLTKDAGLKVGAHMMPGLPGSDPDRDLESFRVLFEDPAYRPDFLKIYPTDRKSVV